MRKLFFALILFPASSYALNCDGRIGNFQIDFSGKVQITASEICGDGTGQAICSVAQEWKGINPEACKGWVSIVLAAKATNQPVRVQYRDLVSCGEIKSWANADAPHMVDLR